MPALLTRPAIAVISAAAAIALAAVPASAAPPPIPLPDCPVAVDTDELSQDQPAVGYTVRRGEVVETFDVTILDVMEGGVAPGRDLVIVEASGPVIEEGGADGGGISAGMSGSPIYTLDGELVGAIAFGFSAAPSPIGGVTPAKDMLSLFEEGAGAMAPIARADRITLDRKARTAVRGEGASRRQVSGGLSRLPLPLTVSGGLAAQRVAMLQRAAERRGLPFTVTGGASAASVTPTGTLAGGDALAAMLSFGDATFAATGTTTYVCDGELLGFGHPFLFGGPTLLAASRAKVFAIVDDDTFGPYKLAAPTEPVGTIDLDRLAGIRGQAGAEIPAFPVLQDTTALDTGRTRLGGRTDVVQSEGPATGFLPDLVFTHALSNIDSTFDQISAGSAFMSWTVRGVDEDSGEHFALTRSNRFTSRFDIAIESIDELYVALATLEGQNLTPVGYTEVDIDVSLERTVRQWLVGTVRWGVGNGPLRNVRRLRVKPRQRIRARVPLTASDDALRRTVRLTFRAPRKRRNGEITISGGGGNGGGGFIEELFCALFGECPEGAEAKTFAELLDGIESRPRNDDLLGRARFGRRSTRTTRRQDRVVRGRDSVRIVMRRGGRRDGGGPPPPIILD